MRRFSLVVLAGTLAACGGSTGGVHPAGTPVARSAAPAARDSVLAQQGDSLRRQQSRAIAGVAARSTFTAKDSVADAAALDSLNRLSPTDTMPELNLVENPVWDINVADYASHPRVQYFVDYFTGRGRERFQIWLERMAQFEPFVRQRLIEHSLPGDLVYLALIESGFSPDAVSKAKAVGMWQFMVATGRGYGLHVDSWVDERRDPIHATDAAARHLADLTAKFGSPYLAAAAYNAGAGRVGRSLDKISGSFSEADSFDVSSDDAFFSLADTRLLKDETKDYVPKLIAAALIAKEPAKYGFDPVVGVVPFSLDSVMVDGGTGLDLIARLADTSLDALHDLNPNLLRMVTPPDRQYAVRVPTGTAEQVAEGYAGMAPDARHAIALHTVKGGETVTALAKKYAVTAEAIRSVNRGVTGTRLTAGKTILVPLTGGIPIATLREPAVLYGVSATHIVKRGETVGGIAKRYHLSLTSVRLANRLTTKSVLRIGQRLTLPGSSPTITRAATVATKSRTSSTRPAATKVVARQKQVHVVRRGETISAIAAHFGVSEAKLMSANGITRASRLQAGQRLKIPTG